MIALAIPDNQKDETSHERDEGPGNSIDVGRRPYRNDSKRIRHTAELADVPGGDVPILRTRRSDGQSKLTETNHEAEISKGINVRSGCGTVDRDCGTSRDRASVAEPAKVAHPVPHLSLVNPVPHGFTKPRASGSTRRKEAGSTRELHPVPQFKGYKWKPSGLTGWELYTRKPSISRNGKRSSKGKYLGYYSKEAVRVLYEATQKTADVRRA